MNTHKAYSIAAIFVFIVNILAFGQTNTFPPNGKVGIGTLTPRQQLSITGGIGFANYNDVDKKLYSPTDGVLEWATNDAAGQHGFAVSHQGTQRIFLNTSGNSYLNGGNVGIGTLTPRQQLSITGGIGFANYNDVDKKLYSPTDGVLEWATNDAAGQHGFAVSHQGTQRIFLNTSGNSYLNGGNLGIGTFAPQTKLDVSGTTRTSVLEITGGSDLAEPFEVEATESIKPGMVVAIDPDKPGQLRVADKAYDHTVAGIISGANGVNPGLTMKHEGTAANGSFPVSLTGRVYCWADASYGAIKPGDLLTTSDTFGHAMKATDRERRDGAMIGKAMSSLKEGKGLLLVLVNLQ